MRKDFDIEKPKKKKTKSLSDFYSIGYKGFDHFFGEDEKEGTDLFKSTPFFDVYDPEPGDPESIKSELNKQASPDSAISAQKTETPKIPKAKEERKDTGLFGPAKALLILKEKKIAQKRSYSEYMALKRLNFRAVKSREGRLAFNLQYREIESTMKSERIDWGTSEFVSLVKSYFPDANLSVTQSEKASKPTAQEEADKKDKNKAFMKEELSVATDNHDLKASKDGEGKNVLEPDEEKQLTSKDHKKEHKLKKAEKIQEKESEEKDSEQPDVADEPSPETESAEQETEEKDGASKETPVVEPVDNASQILEKNKEPIPQTESQEKKDKGALLAQFEAKKSGLTDHAAAVRSNIKQNQAQYKDAMSAHLEAQKAAVTGEHNSKQAALKAAVNGARKQVEASFIKTLADVKATLEKETKNVETLKTNRLKALTDAVSNKKKEFSEYITTKEAEPVTFAKQQGVHIQTDLEAAAQECIQQSNRAAAQFGEKEEKEAALKVGQESAKDIRAKIVPMQQDIVKLGQELKGNYSDYRTKVFEALDQNEQQLKPVIEKKAQDTIAALQKEHDALVAQLEKSKTSSLNSLGELLSQGTKNLEKQKSSTLSGLGKTYESGTKGIDDISSTLLSGVDLIEQDTQAALGGPGDPHMEGVNALVDDAMARLNVLDSESGAKMTEQSAVVEDGMMEAVTSHASGTGQLVQSTSASASKLQTEVTKANQTILAEFVKNALAKVTELDKDTQSVIDTSMKQVDTEIAKVKEKIEAQNTEAKEKISAKTNENLEKAKMPLHDDVFSRAVQAAKEVAATFWEILKGIAMAIGKLVIMFLVVVLIAALIVGVLAFFGFSAGIWAVIGVIGMVVLAGMFIYSLIKRSGEGVGGFKLLGVALADTFGITDIVEGGWDISIVTGAKLNQSVETRSERVTTGVFMVVLLVLGVRGGKGGQTRVPEVEATGLLSRMAKGIDGLGKAMEAGGKWLGDATGASKFASSRFVSVATSMINAVTSTGSSIMRSVKEFIKPGEKAGPKEPVVNEETAGTKTKEEGTGNENESKIKEEEAKQQAKEEAAKKQAEEEARQRKEAEEKQKAEEDAKRKQQEEEQRRQQEEEQRQQEEKAKEKEKPERPSKPRINKREFGDIEATWDGDGKAYALFEPKGSDVHVSDIFRGSQPKGSAGVMLADSLKAAGIEHPSAIRFTNILETQPTLAQLADGVPVSETVLGKTLANAVQELGGKITEWSIGEYRGKQWIEAKVEYPSGESTLPDLLPVEDRPTNPDILNTKENPVTTEEVKDPQEILKRDEAFKSEADPVKDVLGPGRLSHPEEWARMIKEMEDAGVEIRFTEPGNEQLAYAPGLRTGEPGQIVLDPEASISALKHEFQHFKDDQAIGFGGMSSLFDAPLRYKWEFKAYYEEIKLMREQRRFDIARKLLENLRKEKAKIESDIGPVKPEDVKETPATEPESTITGISENTQPHEVTQALELNEFLGGGNIELINSKQGIEGLHTSPDGKATPISLKKFTTPNIKNVFRRIRDNGALIIEEAGKDPNIKIGSNPNTAIFVEVEFTEAEVLEFINSNKSNILPQKEVFKTVIVKTSDGKTITIPTN